MIERRDEGRRAAQPLARGLLAILLLVSLIHAPDGRLAASVLTQPVEPPNGPRANPPRVHALINARIIVRPGEVVESGVIVVRDGVIESVGASSLTNLPADARVWDLKGQTVHAGFIDAAVPVALPGNRPPSAGRHWNSRVHPEVSALDNGGPEASVAKSLRGMGFTAAMLVPNAGVFRGQAAIVSLAEEASDRVVYEAHGPQVVHFETGGWDSDDYPSALIGAVALIRQTFHDADWHARCVDLYAQDPTGLEAPADNDAFEFLRATLREPRTPVLIDAENDLDVFRAARLRDEFGLNALLRGSGQEYKRLDDVIATGLPIVLPVNFPHAPKVESLEDAENIALRTMMEWEQAPTNPRRLIRAGAAIALTTDQLRNREDFRKNLRQAIDEGLTADEAVAALTTTPAAMLGLDDMLGTIEPGKTANLVVVKQKEKDEDDKDEGDETESDLDAEADAPDPESEDDDPETSQAGAQRSEAPGNPQEETPSTAPAAPKHPKPDYGIFSEDHIVTTLWIDGNRIELEAEPAVDPRGVWAATFTAGEAPAAPAAPAGDTGGAVEASTSFELRIDGEAKSPSVEVRINDEHATKAKAVSWRTERLLFVAPGHLFGRAGWEQYSAVVNGEAMHGEIVTATGEHHAWTATRTGDFDVLKALHKQEEDEESKEEPPVTAADEPSAATTLPDTAPESRPDAAAPSKPEGEGKGTRGSGRRGDPGVNDDDELPYDPAPEQHPIPLGPWGRVEPIEPRNVLVRGATIWTSGPEGNIEGGDLYVENGKIAYVGPARNWSWEQSEEEPVVIDARGKHVTPGLIDCHSHTGIDRGSINEGTQAITAEARIADAIDPDDIDWYRQLAGGLTVANQLHGSANPIGGQNSVVKLRWGDNANAFRFENAIPGIKFALGENVKQSNWGDDYTTRYPQTRMGVESIMRAAFLAARDYDEQWQRWQSEQVRAQPLERKYPPRRDLELDALAEILRGERLVHCHSYRQDEILMLIRLAEEMGFTIGTFQHVLEGYKVASEIAAHGAGGSCFTDWWAYKFEVYDAIPYAGAIMHDAGVVVSFNSDSNELARRMNTEAAKAVRYGGLPPEEALQFVTLNPAKQLRIDDRVGSLEEGKDGDFVVWSGDPLSTLTRCEQTWIEGRRMFSLEDDAAVREAAVAERQRLTQKILLRNLKSPDAGKKKSGKPGEEEEEAASTQPGEEGGEPPEADEPPPSRMIAEIMRQRYLRGYDPNVNRPGECGCGWFYGNGGAE